MIPSTLTFDEWRAKWWQPVKNGGRVHLRFQDVCGHLTGPWRITREEWESACEIDIGPEGQFFCAPKFTMTHDKCLVRDHRYPESEYADVFEIRLRQSSSSVVFGGYICDAYHGKYKARDKALAYLIEQGAVEIIDSSIKSEGISNG